MVIEFDRLDKHPLSLQTYLFLFLLGATQIALLASEIYTLFRLSKYKEILENTVELNDISEVWPENEGRMVYLQGFMNLAD